jgi:hypothetical protein
MKLPILTLSLLLLAAGFVPSTHAAQLVPGDLIRASQAAVYYYASDGKRYVFPNDRIYSTWYENFDRVKVIADQELAAISIGGVVTYKPGARMVKIQTDPKVYAVSQGGVLRWISSEQLAQSVYGGNWSSLVQDLLDAFFINYTVGTPITGAGDFIPYNEFAGTRTIDADLERRRSLASNDVPAPIPAPVPTPTPTPSPVPIPTPPTNPCVGRISPTINPAATYLIVTRDMFTATLTSFVEFKQHQGNVVQMVAVDDIACSGSGDVPERMRQFLSEAARNASNLKYVLLVGDVQSYTGNDEPDVSHLTQTWEVPTRYFRPVGSYPTAERSIPTDQYYASPFAAWDKTSGNWAKSFDFSSRFYVGRVPARTTSQIQDWMAKSMAWVPPRIAKESQFMTVKCAGGSADLDEQVMSRTHQITFNYCQTDDGGDIAAIANTQLPDYVTSLSHGNYLGVVKWPSAKGYSLDKNSPGFTKSPIMFIHGCEVAGIDYQELTLGEKLVMAPDGVAAFVGATRSHWDIRFPFWEEAFYHGRLEVGAAVYEAKKRRALENHLALREVDNLFMFQVMGDPQLKIADPGVVVTTSDTIVRPMETLEQPIAVALQSHLGTAVSGRVIMDNASYGQTPISDTAMLSSSASLNLTANMSIFSDVLVGEQLLSFEACNPAVMTCVAARPKFVPTAWISCARTDRSGTTSSLDVKFLRTPGTPITIRLRGKPSASVSSYAEWNAIPYVNLQELPAASYNTGSIVTLSYNNTLIVNPPPPTSPPAGQSYYYQYFTVEALDSSGHILGQCVPSALNEPEL